MQAKSDCFAGLTDWPPSARRLLRPGPSLQQVVPLQKCYVVGPFPPVH